VTAAVHAYRRARSVALAAVRFGAHERDAAGADEADGKDGIQHTRQRRQRAQQAGRKTDGEISAGESDHERRNS
jgi:hypothetical protein